MPGAGSNWQGIHIFRLCESSLYKNGLGKLRIQHVRKNQTGERQNRGEGVFLRTPQQLRLEAIIIPNCLKQQTKRQQPQTKESKDLA